ncbi:MAG: hypothetical protein LVO36_04330 [Nitrosopumilus sp. (ex Thoosa mismalolli)]|nr:hypothetical protein [Nitrosopumilus sp. (ex Thoosa mismalolli)]
MSINFASNRLEACNAKNMSSLAALCFFGITLSASIFLFDAPVFADTTQTTVVKLNDETSLERTVAVMSIPEDNKLPWGAVKGKVNDPAQGYPVIIQIYKSVDDDPIHIAQVNLKGDDSFEYKFRVLSIDEGEITHFFEGDYIVKIFKVINTPTDSLDFV